MKLPFPRVRLLAAVVCVLAFTVFARAQDSQPETSQAAPLLDKVTDKLQEMAAGESSTKTALQVKAAQKIGHSLSAAEWLGPLAPVALSPFFGIACLSGMSVFGGECFAKYTAMLGENSPLNNSTVFFVFAGLTVLTSLPRLTKVSKPLAQAVDQLEAWAGIGTMLIIKWLTGGGADGTEVAVVHAGIFDVGVDTLLAIAGVINIVVINGVKFFFEILIWITPVPFLDACFEAGNKAACAALMAVYAFNPYLAMILNLILFAICLLIFAWARRRELFFRTMMFDAIKSWWKGAKQSPGEELIVFPQSAIGPFSTRAKCRLRVNDAGWTLKQKRLLRAPLTLDIPSASGQLEIESGFFTNTLHITGAGEANGAFTFSRLYNECLPAAAEKFNATVRSADAPDRGKLRAEFA